MKKLVCALSILTVLAACGNNQSSGTPADTTKNSTDTPHIQADSTAMDTARHTM